MHDLMLAILFISIFGLFLESWIVFKSLKTPLHAYLLLSCIATLVNIVGGLIKLMSYNEEAYINALQLSYLGRVWIAFALFMFVAELCHVRLPALLTRVLVVIHILIYGFILTLRYHHLYYATYNFVTDGLFPSLDTTNGIVHNFLMQLQTVYAALAFFWIFRALYKEKRESARRRLWIIIFAITAESDFYMIQIFHIFDITYVFDVTMLGNIVATVFMFVAIFRYNLLGIIDVAREFMIDRLSEAVIAVDNSGTVQYYNEPAKHLLPKIEKEPDEVVKELRKAIENGDMITSEDRIYSPEENVLTDNGEEFGKLYALVDATVLKQNELKLKAEAAVLEMAAQSMRDRLLTAEELIQQDRAMRHDRRHFEALLMSLMQEGKTEEVKKCLEERLSQEPRSARKFCENTTVNAAITHYVSVAERKNIRVEASTNIPFETGVDEMQLAIVVSNLLENAIHACEELPEDERFIEIKAKYKEQLLLEISNPCDGKVPLDEEGHPYATAGDHGIGTKSVLAFVKQTDSEIRYIAEDKIFKVRMII
jgi:signal transduction histidine kinase